MCLVSSSLVRMEHKTSWSVIAILTIALFLLNSLGLFLHGLAGARLTSPWGIIKIRGGTYFAMVKAHFGKNNGRSIICNKLHEVYSDIGTFWLTSKVTFKIALLGTSCPGSKSRNSPPHASSLSVALRYPESLTVAWHAGRHLC